MSQGQVLLSLQCATQTLKDSIQEKQKHYKSKVHVFGNQLTSEKKYKKDNPRGDQMSVYSSSV